MMRPATILALSIGLGLSAPTLAASHGSEQGASQSGQGSSQMQGSQAQSKQQMQQHQAYHQAHRMVIGKVTDTRDVTIKGPAGDKHRLLKLNANDNTVIVDLGAMTQETFKGLDISQGTRIWVLGSSARINGKPVLFARYVGELYDVQAGQGSSQAQAEFSSFEANDLTTDNYGAYDPDFVFLVEDEGWYDGWYGDASDYWEDWAPYGYDDPGEAGWFDW
ncbi:MAG: hypothetical protein L0H73_05985 [Nitrococcus sp.]|nr:hypothetical protein [Nitrococcus sp.]